MSGPVAPDASDDEVAATGRTAVERPASPQRNLAFLALKVVVSGGLIWLLFSQMDIGDVARRFQAISPAWMILAALLVTVQVVLISGRWWFVLRFLGRVTQPGLIFRLSLEGFFFNQALPSSVGGDVIRMMRIHEVLSDARIAVQSVLLDRFMGVLGLVAVVLLAQIWIQSLVNATGMRLLLGVVAGAGVAAITLFLSLSAMTGILKGMRVGRELAELSGRARALLTGRDGLWLILLSVMGQALAAVVFFVLAKALAINLPLWQALVLIPSALLATLIPISIAGWGLREGAIVALLAFVGIPGEAALSLSLLFGFLLLVVSLPGGALWVLRARFWDEG